ncbi:MAG TPA: hypothetical protein VGC42_15015 [Kofleriaceae bacterium]
MVRRGLVLCTVLAGSSALGGCADAAARPTWPKPRAADADGGESLAPRPAARVIAASVEDDRSSERTSDKPASPGISVTQAAAPAPAAAASSSTDDDTTDEITIEIEGDAP